MAFVGIIKFNGSIEKIVGENTGFVGNLFTSTIYITGDSAIIQKVYVADRFIERLNNFLKYSG